MLRLAGEHLSARLCACHCAGPGQNPGRAHCGQLRTRFWKWSSSFFRLLESVYLRPKGAADRDTASRARNMAGLLQQLVSSRASSDANSTVGRGWCCSTLVKGADLALWLLHSQVAGRGPLLAWAGPAACNGARSVLQTLSRGFASEGERFRHMGAVRQGAWHAPRWPSSRNREEIAQG